MFIFTPLLSIGSPTFIVEVIIVVFLGLVLGSFSTALIYRIPRRIPWGLSFAKSNQMDAPDASRSVCTSCHHKLGARDLVPVLSWCMLKGRCRYCQAQISLLYPVAEFICLLSVLGLYFVFDLSLYALVYIALAPVLVALLFIDLAHMILPNVLVGIAAILGFVKLLFLFLADPEIIEIVAVEYIGGAVVFGMISWLIGWIMTKILKKESLGFGDVKFFMMAGLWLGLSLLPYFLILSGVLGFAMALGWKIVKKQSEFPFGPALIASFYILVLAGGSHFL